MEIAELLEKVVRVHHIYCGRKSLTPTPEWYLLKITEELGELVQAFWRRKNEPESQQHLAEECADLIGQVLLFAKQNSVDIEQAFIRKWFVHLEDEPK